MRQLAFDFGDAGSAQNWPTDNMFFAILPEAVAAERTAATARHMRAKLGLSGRPRPKQLLHISLARVDLFAQLPDVIVAARRAGAMVQGTSFNVRFTRLMTFGGRRGHAIVLRCGQGERELAQVRRSVGEALGAEDPRQRLRNGFAPHVTLLYDAQKVPETALTEPIAWRVRELVLVRSLVGQGRYVHLGRWPLRA